MLNELVLMTIESDILNEIDVESVVNDFVTKYARTTTLVK